MRFKELAKVGGPVAHGNFYTGGERKIQNLKGTVLSISNRCKLHHSHVILAIKCQNLCRKAVSLPKNGWTDCKQK